MNPVKDSIGWADFTLNIVTGCKRGCGYCYARRNWNRLHRKRVGCEFNVMHFYPERLHDPDLRRKPPSKIFMDSMSDIQYWTRLQISCAIDLMMKYHNHTFMFLSKNIYSYRSEQWRYMPPNMMQGLTFEKIETTSEADDIASLCGFMPRPFISIEPILGEVSYYLPDLLETIIVGTDSNKGAKPPRPKWIQSVKDHAPAEKIYWKANIKKYL